MLYLTFDMAQSNKSQPITQLSRGDVILKGRGLSFQLITNLTQPPDLFHNFRSYKVSSHIAS